MVFLKKSKKFLVGVICAVMMLFCASSFVLLSNNNTNTAYALTQSTTSSSAVGELWDKTTSKFNLTESKKLLQYLFGTEKNYIQYIKTNGANDSGSIVLPSTKINGKNGVDATKGLTVMLGGIKWMATSMTVATINSTETPILTLMQAECFDASVTRWDEVENTAKGSNMYASGEVRRVYGLGMSSSSLAFRDNYGLFRSGAFATKSLIQPKYINYQKYQTNVGRGSYNYHFPNESFGDTKADGSAYTWYSGINYASSYTYNTYRYDAWQNDYVWIPSASETGFSDAMQTTSIWKLNSTQLSHNQLNNCQWTMLRSGIYSSYQGIYTQSPDGSLYSSSRLYGTQGVRPAIHFNLKSLKIEIPTGKVTKEYKGAEYSNLAELLGMDSTLISSGKVTVTPSATIKDVNTYTCKVTIGSSVDDVIFSGEAETLKEKDITVEITKKPISLTVRTDTTKPPSATISGSFATDTGDRAPQLVYKYSGNGLTNSTTAPTNAGTYNVTIEMTNANYKLDKVYTTTYVMNTTKVVKPTFDKTSKEYNGSEQTFTITNFESSKYTITCANTTEVKVDEANGTVKITNFGTYTINFALKDKINTEWKDATTGNGVGSDNFSIDLKITKKELKVDFTPAEDFNSSYEFELDTSKTQKPSITITTNHIVADDIVLKIYYYKAGTTTKYDLSEHIKVDTTNTQNRTVTFPLNDVLHPLELGSYVLGVELESSTTIGASANKNYEIITNGGTVEKAFSVKGQEASYSATDIVWQYVDISDNTAKVIAKNESDNTYSFDYTGKTYDIKIDTTKLKGLEVDVNKANVANGYTGDTRVTNVKSYTVTVYLKVKEGYTLNGSLPAGNCVTLSFNVNKAKYDLSGLLWAKYVDDTTTDTYPTNGLEYTESTQKVVLSRLSDLSGLTATYSTNSHTNINTYTAIVEFSINDSDNYELPERNKRSSYKYIEGEDFPFTFSWKIIKRTLNGSWISSSDVGEGETAKKGVVIPKLKPIGDLKVNDMVDYSYKLLKKDGSADREEDKESVNVSTIGTLKEERTYFVTATLKSDFTDYYTLSVTEKMFVVGQNVSVVKLVIKIGGESLKSQYTWTGKPFEISVQFIANTAGITKDDLVFKFYECVKESKDFHNVNLDKAKLLGTTIPTAVGYYHCLISVNKDNAEIDGNYDEFLFDIVKAEFDISNLQWEVAHDGIETSQYGVLGEGKWTYVSGTNSQNNEDIRTEAPAFSFDGKGYVFTLNGLDSLPTGLTAKIKYGENEVTGNTFTLTNATYKNSVATPIAVEVIFTIADSMKNTHAEPTFVGKKFNIVIERAVLNATNTQWGYTIGTSADAEEHEFDGKASFLFTRATKEANIEYVVKLIGLPEALKGYIEYPDNNNVQSVVGKYTARFTLKSTFNKDNYVALANTIHSNLPYTFDWEIKPRRFNIPVLDPNSTWLKSNNAKYSATFDNAEHTIVDLLKMADDTGTNYVSLPTDWNLYFNIVAKKDGQEFNGLAIKECGTYTFSFTKTDNNVGWNDFIKDLTLNIEKFTVNVSGWTGSSVKAVATTDFPNFETDFDKYFEYLYYLVDASGNIDENNPFTLDDVLSSTTIRNCKLVKRLKLLSKFETSPNIELLGEKDHLFEIGTDIDIEILTPPTQKGTTKYTGSVIDIPANLIGFNAEIMEILEIKTSTETIVTSEQVISVDTYVIKIGLKESVKDNFVWKTNARAKALTDDVVYVTFTVSKAQIKGAWKTNDKGIPEFVLEQAEGEPNFSDKIKVTYFDESGNEIAKDKLVSGKKYSAKVSLLDNDSFEFVSDDPTVTDPTPANQEFTFKDTSFVGVVTDFVKNNYLYLAIGGGALLLLLLLFLIAKRRKRKNKEQQNAVEDGKKVEEVKKPEESKAIEVVEVKAQPSYPNVDYMQLQQSGMLQAQMQAQQNMQMQAQMQAQQQMAQQNMQQQMAQNMQAQQMQMQQEMERQRQKQELEFERMKHEQEIEKLRNEMRSSQMQQNPQQQYVNYQNEKLEMELQQLRQDIQQLTKYQVASEEEKKANSKLAEVEKMLQQFIISSFKDLPSWILKIFNKQDMINYDVKDLYKFYARLKNLIQDELATASPKEQKIFQEEAQNFEKKFNDYQEKKESSQYEELLREMREKFNKIESDNRDLKEQLEHSKIQQTEKELFETKQELLRKESEFERSREELVKKENELARKESELTKKQDEIETLKEKTLNEKLDEALKKNDK